MGKNTSNNLTTNEKGYLGELQFQNVIKGLNDSNIHMLYNTYLPKSNDRYAQIDFILMSRKKFICVEVKSWDCEVYVSDSRYWKIIYNNREIVVANPIQQNQSHIKTLGDYCTQRFYNRLCFMGHARLDGDADEIVTIEDIVRELRRGPDIYTDEEILDVKTRLKSISDSVLFKAIFQEMEFVEHGKSKPHN